MRKIFKTFLESSLDSVFKVLENGDMWKRGLSGLHPLLAEVCPNLGELPYHCDLGFGGIWSAVCSLGAHVCWNIYISRSLSFSLCQIISWLSQLSRTSSVRFFAAVNLEFLGLQHPVGSFLWLCQPYLLETEQHHGFSLLCPSQSLNFEESAHLFLSFILQISLGNMHSFFYAQSSMHKIPVIL